MRVLLRKLKNGGYYQEAGDWVTNPEKGFDFGTIQKAMDFAWKMSPDDIELALAFDTSGLISAVSMKAAQAQIASVGRILPG